MLLSRLYSGDKPSSIVLVSPSESDAVSLQPMGLLRGEGGFGPC